MVSGCSLTARPCGELEGLDAMFGYMVCCVTLTLFRIVDGQKFWVGRRRPWVLFYVGLRCFGLFLD